MWDLDQKEGWTLKNWCLRIAILEKTLESLLDSKEIKPVHPKGNQPLILIGRTVAKAEALIVWSPHAKSQFIRKDPDAGKDWRKKERRAAEDEIIRWHHWLNGHEFVQTSRDSGGQRSLACYSPRGLRVEHNLATEQQQQREKQTKKCSLILSIQIKVIYLNHLG